MYCVWDLLRLILSNIRIFLTFIRFISCLIYYIKHSVDAELLLQIFSFFFSNFPFRCAVSGSGKITMLVLEKLIGYGALPITVSGTFSCPWIFYTIKLSDGLQHVKLVPKSKYLNKNKLCWSSQLTISIWPLSFSW
jgi:hypothetical protein